MGPKDSYQSTWRYRSSRTAHDPGEVQDRSQRSKMVNLASTPNGVTALKSGNVDGAMLLIPHDLYLEGDGFRPLVYLKDIAEFPLAGLVAHNDRLRDRPNETKNILAGALRGIAYTKAHREEVLPLLTERSEERRVGKECRSRYALSSARE